MQRPHLSSAPADQRLARWICGLLGLVTSVLYWPVHDFQFNNFDDAQYLTQNPSVQHGLTLPAIGWAFTSGYAGNWHPLTWLSHLLDVQLFGFHAGAHHVMNLLLHVANALLVFSLLRCLTGAMWRPAFVAALFAWHPMHVESVAWVAERKDVLSTLFWLLTSWAYWRYVELFKVQVCIAGSGSGQGSKRRIFYALSLLLYALGLMSKPMLVSLPLTLLLLDYWPLHRIKFPFSLSNALPLLREKIPFFVMAAASCVITFLAQKNGGAVQPLENLALADRIDNATVSYVRYLGKLFWPAKLAVIYPYSRHLPIIEVLAAALLLLTICAVVAMFAKTRPPLFVGWLWFVMTLLPVIGLVQVGDQALADRYTYVPAIGLFVLLAWEMPSLFPRFMPALTVAAVIVLCACLVASRRQLRYWRNSVTLFSHAVQVTKDNCLAECNLGLALAGQGLTDDAILHERRAVEINPNYPESQINLGILLQEQGKWDEAEAHLLAALKDRPRYDSAFYNLGMISLRQNRLDEAASRFRSALNINPRYDKAMVNLGIVLAQQGHLDEAMIQYRLALAVAPDNPFAHNALGRVFQTRKQWDQAATQYSSALALQPDFAAAHENLGVVLLMEGRYRQAADEFTQFLRLNPEDIEAHFNLALVLTQLGQTADAIAHYRVILRKNPKESQALQKLAWLLATGADPRLREASEAVRLANESTALTPSDPVAWDTLAAALAEAGRYDEAIAATSKAIALATPGQPRLASQIETRRRLYQSGVPYHQSAAN